MSAHCARIRSRRLRIALVARAMLLLCAAALSACAGKPFDVKPAPDTPRKTSLDSQARLQYLTIQAEAVTDEDYLYETFDANLILAGVLPVRVMLSNAGQEPLDLKKAKFEIKPSSGRRLKSIDARRAFKRLVSYYQISTYSKDGYKESRDDFASYALDTRTPLAAGESRQGMIFFQTPSDAVVQPGMALVVRRIVAGRSASNADIELKLN